LRTAILALVLFGCGGSDPDDTGGPTTDPRADPSSWPDSVHDERPAAVVAPANYDGGTLPLILMLHGYGVNGMLQDLVYQLTPRVDTFGFVLVMPDGTVDPGGARFWNATDACCDFYGSQVNDVRYLKEVLDEVEAVFPIDPARITVLGHSNGGYMSYRMACEADDRIAAIAPLAGANFLDPSDCKADEPVSVLHIHGTEDDSVPYEDNAFAPGAVSSIEHWTDLAGCSGDTEDGGRADYDILVDGDETAITRYQPTGCAEDFAAEIWALEGSGHLPGFTDTFRDAQVEWLLERRK